MPIECPKCKGKKYNRSLDIETAVWSNSKCDECDGRGQVVTEDEKLNGVRVVTPQAQFTYMQKMADGREAATIGLLIFPLIKDGRVIADDGIPLVWAQILSMHTKNAYRNRGHMSALVEAITVKQYYNLTKVQTSWNDSTVEGRNLLLKKGFKQSGDFLEWTYDSQQNSQTKS